MHKYQQNFRSANKKVRYSASRMGRIYLLRFLGKSCFGCVDKLAKSNGCKWTVFNNKSGGVICHFINLSEVENYLYDCYVIRKWETD